MFRRGTVSGPMVAAALAIVVAVQPSPAFAATWHGTATPDPSGDARFTGVEAFTPTEAWAVGYADPGGTGTQPIAARWNGTAWTMTSPPTPNGGGLLNGIDGSAATDVWAVGAAGSAPLTQRWTGAAWSTVAGPSPAGAGSAGLRDVKSFGTGSAWAVGNATVPSSNPQSRTLIERWSGTSWTIVPSPSPDPTQNLLVAVDGVSGTDAWAVGGMGHDGYGGATVAGLVLRWNGSTWTRVTIPGADATFSVIELRDVVAVSATEVWVVGEAFNRQVFRQVPYILRWNGQTWQHSTLPNAPSGRFNSVTALAPDKVYASGDSGGRTLVARWNGTGWVQESTPSPGSYASLLGSSAAGSGTVWTVGLQNSAGPFRALALRTGNG
jgi:hypothetical protein